MKGARLLVLLSLLPAPVVGQSLDALEIHADNDYFNFWRPPNVRPDENYTHGTRVGLRFRSCGDAAELACREYEFAFGQQVFTPFSDVAEPADGDRPYAGLLYTEVRRSQVEEFGSQFVSVRIGVTGKPSLAEHLQSKFHERFGFREPLGWAHQLPFEIAGAVTFGQRRTAVRLGGGHQLASIETEWRATLGTLYTGINAGTLVSAEIGSGQTLPRASVGFRPVVSLVLRDLFLDGSTWSDSHSVRKNHVVGSMQLGAELEWRSVELGYQVTLQSKEFRSQPRTHTYGTIALRVGR